MIARRMRRRFRKLLALCGAALLFGAVLYFTSDVFRAFVRRPSYMWDCKIKRELPDTICLAGAALKDLF